MTKKGKPEPRGIISRYAEAIARGGNPDPPMFFRPGDDESLDAFVDRVWEAIQRRPSPDERKRRSGS